MQLIIIRIKIEKIGKFGMEITNNKQPFKNKKLNRFEHIK
jgi:hypothetical protein